MREGGKPLSHWFGVANAPDSTRRCFSFAVVNRLVLGRRLVLEPPLIASHSTVRTVHNRSPKPIKIQRGRAERESERSCKHSFTTQWR